MNGSRASNAYGSGGKLCIIGRISFPAGSCPAFSLYVFRCSGNPESFPPARILFACPLSAGQRISRQGYPWRTYGEDIAVGYPTVSSVLQGWLGSEGHCRNLMDPAFTEIGAGYTIGPFGGNPASLYWTFDLADR